MNSILNKNIDSDSIHHPYSVDFQDISLYGNKYKQNIVYKNNNINNYFNNNKRTKISLKYIENYVHKYFIFFYKNRKDDYNIRMIEDILNNESTHLVAEFKDYLIMGDFTEFLQKSYDINECKKYLPKIYEYYNSCSLIFPNYFILHESKYIYKKIRKKQKIIDNQQEQEEKKEKIRKGDIKLDDNDNDKFFSSKTFDSILEQTNTSNIKYFFGINDDNNVDANETPNNIVEKLEHAENEAMQRKINLIKNKKNSILNNNNINENDNINNIFYNSNFINNIKLYNNNKSFKDKNKRKGNIHYLSTQKRNNIKLNMNMNNIYLNNHISNKITINSYLSKNNQYKNENDSKKNIILSTNITDTDNENNNKNNKSRRKDTRKLFIENNVNNQDQIYNKNNINHSNNYINKQFINSLFPTKNKISKISNNFDNNSLLNQNQNSFNYINKKFIKRNIKDDNIYMNNPNFLLSPSSLTIEPNPFKRKYNYNLSLNIKGSNSTINVISNYKIKENHISNEKMSLKNIEEEIKRNDKNHFTFNHNNNNNTISTIIVSKSTNNRDKIKYIHTNKKFNYNKAQIRNNYQNHNFYNFRTIVNNTRNNINLNNNNINYNRNIINYYNNNAKYINNINIKNLYIQKFNSTSNIKKPINMNININMDNNNKNKIYLNEGSYGNIINHKINPLSIEMEPIKVPKKKYSYPKSKNLSKNKGQNNIFYNNYNENIINSIYNNKLVNDKYYNYNSLGHSPLDSINQYEDFNNDVKNNLIKEELNMKKKILPIGKKINNININGCSTVKDCLTARTSNNVSKKKYKRNNNRQDINYYNYELKIQSKNKKLKKNNNNNLISRNGNNPVIIKKLYDNIKNNKKNNNYENPKISGFFTSRKK